MGVLDEVRLLNCVAFTPLLLNWQHLLIFRNGSRRALMGEDSLYERHRGARIWCYATDLSSPLL